MEGRASVAEALLASAESAEVLSGLGDDVIVTSNRLAEFSRKEKESCLQCEVDSS